MPVLTDGPTSILQPVLISLLDELVSEVTVPEGGGGSPPPAGVQFVGATVSSSGNVGDGNRTFNKPAGVEEGDLLLAFCITRNSVPGVPSGWAKVQDWSVLSGSISTPFSSGNEVYVIWSKTAGDSEPSSYTVFIDDQGTNGEVIVCAAFRNVGSLVGLSANHSVGQSPSQSALAGDMLLCAHAAALDNLVTVAGAPGDMTMAQQDHVAFSQTAGAVAYQAIEADGATGIKTWSPAHDADFSITLSLLLRP